MPAAATVTAALGSRSAVARFVAAEVLGRLGATTAGPALERRLLRDGSSEVRQRAATALGRIGLPGAYAALRAATGASVPVPVRAAATRALGELGDPSGIRALWSLLGDPEERVAAQAGPALVQLGPAGHRVLREVAAQDGTGRSLAVQRARDALSVAELLGQVPASEPARPELVAASAGAEGDR
jgi:HEAT repeat protein